MIPVTRSTRSLGSVAILAEEAYIHTAQPCSQKAKEVL
jgi:hypothetical protein